MALKLTIFGFPINVAPIGMPLFFTLSGFVVHYVYASGLVTNYAAEVKDFAIARFARIYPLFALLLAFYALGDFGLSLLRHPDILISFASLTGSWWYWTLDGRPLIDTPYGISWSISTEAFFYVAYAAGLYRIAGVRDPRICAGLLLVFCVGSLVALFGFYWLATDNGIDFSDPYYRWIVYVSPYFHLLEFVGGCLACQLVMAAKESRSIIRPQTELLGSLGIVWIVGAMFLLYVAWHSGHSSFALHFVNFLHTNFLMVPGCLMLLIAVATAPSRIASVLSLRPLLFVGAVSYSIYLGHMLVVRAAVSRFLIDYPGIAAVLAPVAVIALAAILYRFFERPAQKWLRRSG